LVLAGRVALSSLPFIDEHVIEVAAPRDEVWARLERFARRSLLSGGGPFHRMLGTEPRAGFAVAASVPGERLELAGRHRFSRYVLEFALRDGAAGTTRLAARSFAEFPGVHGSAYRALVIGTRLHVLATRGMLRAIATRR
jgi:hypothetical protein